MALKAPKNAPIMDLYTHIVIRLPYIINMAPYTEIIKRHRTAALKTSNGLPGNIHYNIDIMFTIMLLITFRLLVLATIK